MTPSDGSEAPASPSAKLGTNAFRSNALAASSSLLLVTVFQIALVPLYLASFGLNGYADWLVLTAIPAYLSLADFGLSAAAATEATACRLRDENERADRLLASTVAAVLLASALLISTLALVAYLAPLRSWLDLESLSEKQALSVFTAYLCYVVTTLLTDFFVGAYRSHGFFATGLQASNALRLGDGLATASALILDQGAVVVATSLLVVRLAGLACFSLAYVRRFGSRAVAPTSVRWSALAGVAAPGIAFLAFPIGNAILNQGAVLTLGLIAEPRALVAFTSARTASNGIRQVNNLLVQASTPRLSTLLAQGERDAARRLNRRSLSLAVALSALAALPLLVAGPQLISLWLGMDNLVSRAFLTLMLFQVLVDAPWLAAFAVLIAENRHSPLAIRFLFSSLVTTALVPVGYVVLGLNGVALALFVPTAMVTPRALRDKSRALRVLTIDGSPGTT